jgi:hypothetical protein
MRHPQLRGVANMTLSGTTVSLEYAGRQDSVAWQQMIADFEALAAGILKEAAQQGLGQRAQALYVYQYLVNDVAFVQSGAADGWGALTSGQAIAPGFAQALAYLLDRLGIECHMTTAADGSHVWNTALLDGQYYHLDAAYEAAAGSRGLAYFAMDDARRRESSVYGSWRSGDARYADYETPACADEQYAFQGTALGVSYDRDAGMLYWADAQRTLYGRPLAGGEPARVTDIPVIRVGWQDGFLYILDARDYKTYCLDAATGTAVPAEQVNLGREPAAE